MTTIPDPPQIATIPLPLSPTLNIPVAPSILLTEPPIQDPTGALRAFTYEAYGSTINDLVKDKLLDLAVWAGDAELFAQELDVAADEAILELLAGQNKMMSAHGAAGFNFMSGATKGNLLRGELAARMQIQQSGVQAHAQQSEWAIQFVDFAFDSGSKEIRFATDEKKNIIYANMAKVEEIAKVMLATVEEQTKAFDLSARLFDQALKAVNSDLLGEELKVMDYSAGIAEQRAGIRDKEVIFDAKHAENTGVIINNTAAILQAKECLNEAEIEKLKVLKTHADLNGYLARIREAHAKLVVDRTDIEEVAGDLERYKKNGKLIEQEARLLLEKNSAEQQKLDQMFKLSMSQIQKAKVEISAFEQNLTNDKIDSSIAAEEYKYQLQAILVSYQNDDYQDLGASSDTLATNVATLQAHFTTSMSSASAGYRAEKTLEAAEYAAETHIMQGNAKYAATEAQTSADTELKLLHQITGGA